MLQGKADGSLDGVPEMRGKDPFRGCGGRSGLGIE